MVQVVVSDEVLAATVGASAARAQRHNPFGHCFDKDNRNSHEFARSGGWSFALAYQDTTCQSRTRRQEDRQPNREVPQGKPRHSLRASRAAPGRRCSAHNGQATMGEGAL